MIVHDFCSNLYLYLGLYLNGKQITKFQVIKILLLLLFKILLILVLACVYFNDNYAKLAGLIALPRKLLQKNLNLLWKA